MVDGKGQRSPVRNVARCDWGQCILNVRALASAARNRVAEAREKCMMVELDGWDV